MGPARTQFVPIMGKENKYQAPGAAQAPTVSQTGQRGQVMGRGQGSGPQAGISGTHKRFYAITPQTEIEN